MPFEYRYEKTFPLPATRSIQVASEDADVVVRGSDRNDILIQARYQISSTPEMLKQFSYALDVAEGAQGLHIAEHRRAGRRNFAYDQQAHSIVIEVPRNANVTLQEEDGACVISGIDGRVDLSLDDGKVDLRDCRGDIVIAMDNGNFSISNCPGSIRYR